jgi:hypothetical protein
MSIYVGYSGGLDQAGGVCGPLLVSVAVYGWLGWRFSRINLYMLAFYPLVSSSEFISATTPNMPGKRLGNTHTEDSIQSFRKFINFREQE